MICLDTPLLEDLLCGRKRALRWLQEVQDQGEVAATEVSMIDLALRAGRLPGGLAAPRGRQEALHRLRRSLTVLPLDSASVNRVLSLPRLPEKAPPDARSALEVVGICLAHGVEELRTSQARWIPPVPSALRVVRV